jgi:hypothetical protein
MPHARVSKASVEDPEGMPSHHGSAPPLAAAGWYADPLGPSNRLRWWDGKAWSSSVQTPAAPRSAPAPRPAPKRRRRTVAWSALGAFGLAVTGVVIAVNRGQDVCEVSAAGIKFCENDEDARQEIEQAQPALEQQASVLEVEAQEEATAQTTPSLVDLNGTWTGDNGFTYVIEQFGNQAVISEIAPGGLTTAVGMGSMQDSTLTFDFEAVDGSAGTGTLQLDGGTLRGVFANVFTGLVTTVELRR